MTTLVGPFFIWNLGAHLPAGHFPAAPDLSSAEVLLLSLRSLLSLLSLASGRKGGENTDANPFLDFGEMMLGRRGKEGSKGALFCCAQVRVALAVVKQEPS